MNHSLSLDGPWQFRAAGSLRPDLRQWMPATAPGTVHHHLHQLGKIADPHHGRNELDIQWIDQVDWEWRRKFHVDQAMLNSTRQELIFDGLDTVATICVNGREVGRSANMFRQVVCNVRGVLKRGANELRILFKSPTEYAKQAADRGNHRVAAGDWKWQTGESRPTYRAWIRKTQCHFGWDWGLYLATSGIWQSCRLESSDGPRIAALTISQRHDGRRVTLRATAHLAAPSVFRGKLIFRCGQVFSDATITSGNTKRKNNGTGYHYFSASADLVIDAAKLWWPVGEGEQHLYNVSVECEGSRIERRIGLRTLELVTEPDKSPERHPGESFYFRVNGRPIFAKGANWIPPDQFVDRCTPNVYRHLLQSMVEANMNIVRIWGGGWYEQDIFYDLCDELGLLVWQDFMMACALYPDTKEFIDELTAEATYQTRRLQSRACIVLWCGDNEDAEAVWRWWRDSPDFQKNVRIYKKVMTALRRTVEREDPTRRFWLSSPSNNDFNGDCTNPDRGDVHYWTVWHGKQPFSNYYTVRPRFASEFGFQSFPEPRTIRAVVPAEELNPSSRVMEHHQRSPEGNMLITNTMAREMRIPKDFDSFCYLSQINQAMAIRTAVEHWRRLRPWCMGTIYWQVNDLWPVASWSSIDYHGRWKVLHHYAKRFFSPLLGSIVHEGEKVSVWGTSDLAKPIDLDGELEVFTWAGKRIARQPVGGKLKAGESRALRTFNVSSLLADKVEPHEVCLFLRLRGDGVSHENFATLVPWKWVALPEPKVNISLEDGPSLSVSSEQVIPFFHAELQGLEGHFGGDWQVMLPRTKYVMKWMPHIERGAEAPSLHEAKRSLRTTSLFDTYE